MSNIRIYNDEIYNNYNKKLNEIYKYISDLSIIAINNVDNENRY
jgi:hypothetical protein